MSDSQRIGLYYPYLHFSDDWLKVAALYWPRIGRIASKEILLNDSYTVRALSDELGFVLNVAPGSAASKLRRALIDVVDANYEEFRDKYSIPDNPNVMSDICSPAWPKAQPVAMDLRAGNPYELRAAADVVAIHKIKLDRQFFQFLLGAGLAFMSGDWVCLHPEFAWLYMYALADELAYENLLVPTTDQLGALVESLSWTTELFVSALRQYRATASVVPPPSPEERIALLALSFVIPRNLGDVPVQKIIKIRQRYAADFDAFYDEVADLVACINGELSEIINSEVLAAYIDYEAQRRFRQPLETLRRQMQGQGVDATVTALTTKFEIPTSAAILAGGVLAHHPLISLGGLVAMGLVSTVRGFNQGRHQMNPSAASYLWRIEPELQPRDMLQNLVHHMY